MSSNIDKLTLELLMNKSNYQKYLSQSHPQRAEENRIFKTNLRKYSANILKMTRAYLDNPDEIQVTNEVNDMLEIFGKTWIKYFETKELENPEEYNKTKDEDMLFDENQMESTEIIEDMSSSPMTDTGYPFLNKKLKYSMDYYSRAR